MPLINTHQLININNKYDLYLGWCTMLAKYMYNTIQTVGQDLGFTETALKSDANLVIL